MVMKNNNPRTSGYVYGNTAYDYETRKKVVKEKKPLESPKPKRKKAKKSKVKVKIKLMSAVAIIFVMAFITVGRYTTILALSSDIRSQKGEIESIKKDNQNINVELAKLNNLNAIESDAKNKYSMVKSTKDNTYYINVKPLKSEASKVEKKESALTALQRMLGLVN